ncbi:O-antigen ligase family protein [Fluviicola sp.]|uniref:O-antigen ligase family protein n=1 Tax=Fluviicola sp. TaxID=1917219 RepID=UPI0031D89887
MTHPNRLKLNTLFVFLLIFTLIGGSHMVVGYIGGVECSAYRFVLAVTMVYLLVTKQFSCYTGRFSKYLFYLFVVWFLYGVVSLCWAPDLMLGIRELFYMGVGISTYLVLFSFSRFESAFEKLFEKVWTISFIAVIGFLCFEMLTQRHLKGEYLQKLAELGAFHRTNFIPIFTFINQNILGIYFCLSIIFSGFFLLTNRNTMLHVVMILVSFDFLLLTESRLGVLCVVLLLLVTLFLFAFRKIRKGIPASFTRKHVWLVMLLLTFNTVLIASEMEFLDSNSELQFRTCGEPGKVYREVGQKLDQRLKENGKILLSSGEALQKQDTLKTDRVFVIEQHAYLKLLNGDTVKLQLKQINPELRKAIFMGNNKLLIALLFALLAILLTAYLVNYRFEKYSVVSLVFCVGLFLVVLLPANSYEYPFKRYKQIMLAETGTNLDKLEASDLGIISSDAATGELLLTGKPLKAFLYSKGGKQENGVTLAEKLNSNDVRKNQFLNGLDYLEKSRFMGLGAGGFQASNLKKMNKYPDNGVVGAHNFMIEILSQYGILIFSLLASMFGWIIFRLVRASGRGWWDSKHFLVLWLLIALVFMGNANSTFLSLPINWFLVACVFIVANELMESRKEHP